MFFSLSLGMGAMITYGSYLDREGKHPEERPADRGHGLHGGLHGGSVRAARLALLWILKALWAARPCCLLPCRMCFSRMGTVGPIFGIIFYLLVVFAAISSSISLLEVIVAHFVDKARAEGKGDKRKSYTLIATATGRALAVFWSAPTALGTCWHLASRPAGHRESQDLGR